MTKEHATIDAVGGEDAQVLNRLAQALAGAGSAEINYHGVTFKRVDDMALRAVRR